MAKELRNFVHGNAALGHPDFSTVAQIVRCDIDQAGALDSGGKAFLNVEDGPAGIFMT